MISNTLFGVICLLIVIFVVLVTPAIVYQVELNSSNTAKNPWCYVDWKCFKKGKEEVVNSVKTIIDSCTPITAERAAELNTQNKKNINPSVGNSAYAACKAGLNKSPSDTSACPAYAKGDIDWTECVPAKCYPAGQPGCPV